MTAQARPAPAAPGSTRTGPPTIEVDEPRPTAAPAATTPPATTPTVDAEQGEERDGALRATAVGAIVGFVVVALSIFGGALLWGSELGSAIGLALFVGFWGGGGFGVMLGASLSLSRKAS